MMRAKDEVNTMCGGAGAEDEAEAEEEEQEEASRAEGGMPGVRQEYTQEHGSLQEVGDEEDGAEAQGDEDGMEGLFDTAGTILESISAASMAIGKFNRFFDEHVRRVEAKLSREIDETDQMENTLHQNELALDKVSYVSCSLRGIGESSGSMMPP